jgi:hypothetical protein
MELKRIDFVRVAADCGNPNGAQLFNTCFHTVEEADVPRPREEPYSFSRWLPLILKTRKLDSADVQIVNLTPAQARLLLSAASASIVTGRFNQAYLEDIREEIVEPSFSSIHFPDSGLFMRLNGCSPKDGKQIVPGQPAIHSVEDAILRLTTSERARNMLTNALDAKDDKIPVIFLPFNDRMASRREYRVYCNPIEARITAISQYCWHKPWFFGSHPSGEQEAIAQEIWRKTGAIHRQIMSSLRQDDETDNLLIQQGFSFDVFYDEDTKTIELVELNVFGARSGCGSCLFHWIQDFDLLYGKVEEVEFRVAW